LFVGWERRYLAGVFTSTCTYLEVYFVGDGGEGGDDDVCLCAVRVLPVRLHVLSGLG